MKRRLAFFIVAALVVYSMSSGATGVKKMNFFYEFRPNATYTISQDIENDMTMELKGNIPEEYDQISMAMQNVKTIAHIDMQQTFGNPDEQGNIPFEGKFVDYRVKTFMGGQEMQLPEEMQQMINDSMKQMKMTGKITRRGKLLEFDLSGMKEMPDLSSEEIKKLYSLVPEFPEKELSIGDDFTYSYTAPFEWGIGEAGVQGELTFTNYYHLKDIREGAAYFDVRIDYKMSMKGEKEKRTEMEGTGKGNAVYDIEKHFFMAMNTEGDFSMLMDLPMEQSDEQKAETEQPQMMSKMKTIMKMTMTLVE